MITWYLVIMIVTGGGIQKNVYSTEQAACQAYLVAKNGGLAYIYQVSGRKDSPAISDGDCKPVQQFVTTK